MSACQVYRFVSITGWVFCLCVMAFALAQPAWASNEVVQWSPWFIGLFLLGIPHGALDHLIGSELTRSGGGASSLAAGPRFYTAYLLAAGLVLVAWLVWPTAALAGFLAIAALHFGQGDVYWSHQLGLASQTGSRGYRATLLLTRSLIPVALPLLTHPGELSVSAELMGGQFFGQSQYFIMPPAIQAGMVGLATLIGLQVGWAVWLAWGTNDARKRAASFDILETLILVGLFVTTPPVLAIGVYFNAWHSLRHLSRLLMATHATQELIASGKWRSALSQLFKTTLPMTCGALLLISIIPYLVLQFQVSVANLGLFALIGLSMLTLPHVFVVIWMDIRQGVWSPLPGSNSCGAKP